MATNVLSDSLYKENALRNITPTRPKPLETVTLEQQLKKLGKLKELKEKYPEKEADQKMKGIQ